MPKEGVEKLVGFMKKFEGGKCIMYNYTCLNPIAGVGLNLFSDDYSKVEDIKRCGCACLSEIFAMHDMELRDNVLAVARAGAGVNNIPLDKCAEKGIVVFNTPGANANGVKELVIAGMLYASRDIVGGIDWCLANQSDENIAKVAEKQKRILLELKSQAKTWCYRTWCDWCSCC